MNDTLEKIYKAGLKFLDPLDPQQTYATIIEEAVKLVKADYGSIALQEDGEFKKVYSTSPVWFKSEVRKKANAYKVFTTGKPIILGASKTNKAHPELDEIGIKSSILIPLSYRKKAIGVLIVNSRKVQHFGENELEVLKLFGSQASLAIRKTQLYNETKQALETRDLFISMAAHELRTP